MKIQEPCIRIGSQLNSSTVVVGFNNFKGVGPRVVAEVNGKTTELELDDVEAIYKAFNKSV